MDRQTLQHAHLLVLEPDDALRLALEELLREEGYQVSVAASLAEGLAWVQTQSCALILADLFVGRYAAGSSTPAHTLRRRVQPIPVGLLMTAPLSETEALRAGFAFVLGKPFELEDLLTQVAEALPVEFTAEQERQADVVRRYLAALVAQDWESLLALCTPDVRYYPPAASGVTPARRLQGQTAFRAYAEAAAQHYHQVAFADLCLYARPKGLVAQYTSQWLTPDGRWKQVSLRLLFHFVGESIDQIGVQANLARLQLSQPARVARIS